ncbi:MAG: SPOR domain-containing protein, partial [Nitrospirae bacterium]
NGSVEDENIPSIYDLEEESEVKTEENQPELEETYKSVTKDAVVGEPPAPAQEQKIALPKEKEIEPPVVEKPAPEKKKKTIVAAYKPIFSEHGRFVVQVGSFSDKRSAVNMLEKFKHRGYPAYISISEDGSKVLYRVRIGNFDSFTEAKAFGEQVLKKMGYNYWVDNRR